MAPRKTSVTSPEPQFGEPLDNEELLRYFWHLKKQSEDYYGGDRRKEHRKLQDMYFGKPLEDSDVAALKRSGREPINFNYFASTVNAIVGTEAADRKECVFKPDDEDPDEKSAVIADWMTIIGRKQIVGCNGARVMSDAFQDELITGCGFSDVYLDVSRMPMRVVVKPLMETEVYPDPDAREPNYMDGQFFITVRSMTLEEVQGRWTAQAAEIEAECSAGSLPTVAPTENVDGVPSRKPRPNRRSKINVWRFQYWRPTPRRVWYDPVTNERRDTSPAELAQREEEMAAQVDPATGQALHQPIQQFSYTGRTYWQAWIVGDEKTGNGGIVLEHQEMTVAAFTTPAVNGFRYKDYDSNRLQHFGIGLLIAYAQLYLDKALRVWLEIQDRAAKGGGWAETDALVDDDFAKFVRDVNRPGNWVQVAPGGIAKIQEREVAKTPEAYARILDLCRDAMAGLSSVTDVVKGTAETERSNVLVTNLQGQSRITWGPLFENYTSYVMNVGKLVVAISLKHLPDMEIDRLIGPVQVEGMTHTKQIDPASGEEVWQPIMVPGPDGQQIPATPSYYLKEEDPFLYRVTVDVGEASPTAKNAFWMILQQGIGKMLTDLGVDAQDILPVMAKNMPLPGIQANELAKRIEDRLAKKRQLEAPQGVAAALQGLGPQGAQQVIQQVAQALKLDLGGQGEERGEQQKSPLKVTGKFELMTPDEQAQLLAQVGVNADPQREQGPAVPPPPTTGAPPPGVPGVQ